MKICLIRPAIITMVETAGEDAAPPLGIAYLAATLRQHTHDVTVIDALGDGLDLYSRIPEIPKGLRHGLCDEEILERIPVDTDMIGLSCMFSLGWPSTRELAFKICQHFPNTFIIVGGEHITSLPEYSLQDCPAIDCCVLGEGEQTLLDVITVLTSNGDLQEVSGLCLRDGNRFLRTPSRARLRALEVIPPPAWDLVPIDKYLDNKVMTGVDLGRSIPIMASRGCPYRCTFCSNPTMWGTLWKARQPEDVFDEMREYMRRYNVTNFDFNDLTAIVNRGWIVNFCKLIIDSGVELTWQLPSGTRSEALDAEVTALLYKSGCRYVNYAPESGCDEILLHIKKQISKTWMLQSMRHAVRNGLNVKANVILGFPSETLSHVKETYKFILQMARAGIHDVAVFPFSPYPGSELFNLLHARGNITLDDAYFHSLAQYTNPLYMKSYSDHLSNTQLRLLCLLGMAVFYAYSFLRHPTRLMKLFSHVIKGVPKTKLTSAIVRVNKKRREFRKAN